jgi:hypothetical protein
VSSLFCRHNRFTADCPICSKGTLLDPARRNRQARSTATPKGGAPRPGAPAKRRSPASPVPSGPFAGPYVSVGPYEREDGTRYDVRLERVPGGIRLAEWSRGQLVRRAPVLPAADLGRLVTSARERGILPEGDLTLLADALALRPGGDTPSPGVSHGASPGRAGDMQDELRLEAAGAPGMVRVARWLLRPGRGWFISEAPTLFPAERYAEALAQAARAGVLAGDRRA